ncbi:MAG: hypothetical protein ACT4QC_23860 [Planctomycetaceae bacterium]
MADSAHAVELLQAEMEILKDSKDSTRAPHGVQDAITLLLLPPNERLRHILMFSNSNVVRPHEDE